MAPQTASATEEIAVASNEINRDIESIATVSERYLREFWTYCPYVSGIGRIICNP